LKCAGPTILGNLYPTPNDPPPAVGEKSKPFGTKTTAAMAEEQGRYS
jgi:hypothetical protein